MVNENTGKSDSKFRVALLGIYHESNTFIDRPTQLEDFTNSHWLKGESIISEYQHAHHEIGGLLEALDRHGIEAVPIMFAEATPGGALSRAAYETLLNEMMDILGRHLPVDGCLVVPHGAGVAEGYFDMDGHWLSTLRKIVGDQVPLIGTLDPHANVSQAMAKATNALVAYKTNPHIDQRETGRTAAELMVKTLYKEINPVQELTRPPVTISIEQQFTAAQPCKDLYSIAESIGHRPGILSVSIMLGFPYADVEEMGSSFLVVSDGQVGPAIEAGEHLCSEIIKIKDQCVGDKKDINAVLPLISQLEKPVLLLDMGDNVGGGSPGDSAFLLKAIVDYGHIKSFCCIYDAEAVTVASTYSVDEEFKLSFGNQTGETNRIPFHTKVKLLRIAEGKFTETSPKHGGQVNYDMGRIAIVSTAGGNTVLLHSLRVPPFSLNQITSFGICPENFDVVIAKGVNAPIAAYSDVCPTIIQVNTPGVTQADMTVFPFRNRRKPLFPFEDQI